MRVLLKRGTTESRLVGTRPSPRFAVRRGRRPQCGLRGQGHARGVLELRGFEDQAARESAVRKNLGSVHEPRNERDGWSGSLTPEERAQQESDMAYVIMLNSDTWW